MTNWPFSEKPKSKMTNTRGLTTSENLGVFVILSGTGVICPVDDQFPAHVSFLRDED
jgi:hypothetical protein